MSSQNVFLDQRMKGKESFPYTVAKKYVYNY
jgi:hypothetical protein